MGAGTACCYYAQHTTTSAKNLLGVLQDKGKTILFEHLGPRQQPPDTYVSVNSLTYSTPHLDKRHVHTELWCGAKANDLNVTQKQAPAGQLTADKKTSWSAHATPERNTKYASSTRSTQMQTALLSDPRKRDCKAAATNATAAPGSGCQQPTIGRKVTGEMSVWVDRNERMMTMLDFRKPIDYTVTLTCKDAVTGTHSFPILPGFPVLPGTGTNTLKHRIYCIETGVCCSVERTWAQCCGNLVQEMPKKWWPRMRKQLAMHQMKLTGSTQLMEHSRQLSTPQYASSQFRTAPHV